MDMLTSLDVTVTWTWEQTMRETIVLPMYKALRTLAERKAAFEKYLVELHEAEVKARLDSLDKSRKAWMTGMQNFGGGMDAEEGVKSWWGWEKARIQLEKRMPAVWNALRNDEERKTLFNEFMSVTKTAEAVSEVYPIPRAFLRLKTHNPFYHFRLEYESYALKT